MHSRWAAAHHSTFAHATRFSLVPSLLPWAFGTVIPSQMQFPCSTLPAPVPDKNKPDSKKLFLLLSLQIIIMTLFLHCRGLCGRDSDCSPNIRVTPGIPQPHGHQAEPYANSDQWAISGSDQRLSGSYAPVTVTWEATN